MGDIDEEHDKILLKMARKHKKELGTRTYKNYSEEKLETALRAIKNGSMSLRTASKMYKIPTGTLSHKLNKKHGQAPGRPLALTEQEEDALVNHLQTVSEWGFPCTLIDLRMVTKSLLDKTGKKVSYFKNNLPSIDWSREFLKRHKNILTQRLAQNIKTGRAKVGKEVITSYFNNLEKTLKDKDENGIEFDIPPTNLFNYDETNLSDDPGRKKCIFKRGVKYPERVKDSSKTSISIMFCGSASGVMLPVYVVYKSEHLWTTWTEGGPPRSRYNRSKSGWFDYTTFTDWFKTTFIPETRHLHGKKILIGDNLSSHFGDEVLKMATEHNVVFVCLPPNSTHLLQPLDVAFFRPLKTHWRAILDEYKAKIKRGSKHLTKEAFPGLLNKLHQKLCSSNDGDTNKNIIAGFKATGIHPFQPEAVIQKIPENQLENVYNVVSESLIELLKDMRGVDTDQQRKKRKRRIDVEPGTSVADARNNNYNDQDLEETQRKKARKQEVTISDDGSETNDEREMQGINEDEEEEGVVEDELEEIENERGVEITEDTEKSIELIEIELNRFYVIQYKINSKKKTDDIRYYVAKVTSLITDDMTFNAIFLKINKKMSTKTEMIFSWPEARTEFLIESEQVECLLPDPKDGRRGTLVFPKKSLQPFMPNLN